MYMKIIIIVFIGMLFCTNVHSQTQSTDNQLWTGASLGLKLNKKFTLKIREEFRFGNDISEKSTSFTDLGLKYKINKHFSLTPHFRFIDVPVKKNKRRLVLDLNYKWKKKDVPISFKYRLRIQDTKKIDSKKQASDYLRNKFEIGFNTSKLVDPFIAYELYYRFDNKNEFRKARFTLGLDWKINKQMGLTTYYRIQKDINVKNPVKLKIIGVSFSYNLSLKKLKAKKK